MNQEELAEFDGKNGKKLFIAIKEKIYDFTGFESEHPGNE